MSAGSCPEHPDNPDSEANTDFSTTIEGYEPFYQELLSELGRFSLTSAKVMDEIERKNRGLENLKFLNNFSNLLPHFSYVTTKKFLLTHRFEIEQGPNAQYIYRQLQSQTIWAGDRVLDYIPYFVIGEERSEQEKVHDSLLLLPATREKGQEKLKSYQSHPPLIVNVDPSFVNNRENFARSVEAKPLTKKERERSTDPKTGSLLLTKNRHLQCVELSSSQMPVTRFMESPVIRLKGIDPGVMKTFRVYEHVAKLALAFHIKERTRDLFINTNSDLSEKPQTYKDRLNAQNQQLMADIKDLMIKTNGLSEEEVDSILGERYPNISETDG